MKPFMLSFRPFLAYAALFSVFTNILLLVPALYMLQVFDRVLTSRSNETLLLLTLGTWLELASSEAGEALPAHVERTFRRYPECGILAHGFART